MGHGVRRQESSGVGKFFSGRSHAHKTPFGGHEYTFEGRVSFSVKRGTSVTYAKGGKIVCKKVDVFKPQKCNHVPRWLDFRAMDSHVFGGHEDFVILFMIIIGAAV